MDRAEGGVIVAVCLINKSGGGVSSDDVTAKREHVVQGFTALTSDSGDEPTNGALANKGNGGAPNGVICPEMFYYTPENAYVTKFDAGAYYNAGERGQWKPYVTVPVWMAKQATNYHPEKTLSDTVTCQEQGTVKMINTQDNNYRINKSAAFGIDWWSDPNNPVFWVDFPHGNGFYHRSDNHPHTCIDAVALGDVTADKVMRGFTATSKNGVKFAGTMPDYSTGRTVFNGATFDNTLLSGVADKGFYVYRDLYSKSLDNSYRYSGIYDGGINLNLSTGIPSLRGRYIGCIFSQSVNLTPFNRIDVYWRFLGDVRNGGYINLSAGVSKSSSLRRSGMLLANGTGVDGFTDQSVITNESAPQVTKNGKMELYVGGINEQAFLYIFTSANISSNRDLINGRIQITRIDFLN